MDIETQEVRQARQRASVKWILSKAFNNRVPDNLKEPFYRDHENQEHLKPQIVVGLGNATLYCQTLSNLYSDPNYQSLNHWSILQTLARKGVPITESPDMPLTETVLIQTNPLRINAHMSVIEALMILYAKEISSGDRIPTAIRRISGSSLPNTVQNYESALLCWVSHVCAALKKRIDQDIETGATDADGVRLQSPDIPPIRDYRDLCDGVCLAFLISYYCPKVVPWTSVRVNYLPAVEDSIHNVLLVSNFSQKHLPYSVFHMTPEDITYMRGSMKQNLVVLLADLFNLFEIHPAKCVCYPGMEQSQEAEKASDTNEHGISHRRGLTCQPVTPIPDLRSSLDTPSGSPTNRPPFQVTRTPSAVMMRRNTPPKEYQTTEQMNTTYDEGFVVHRSRGVTTLSSMQEPLVPARLRQAKEKTNTDTKADERGDSIPAGRPSNWEETRRPSYAGRRSRRNSSSEDSQLTIENFGGSQDQLNMIGRMVERERERERKISNTSIEPAVAVRSSLADARGTIQIGYDTDSGSEKQDKETEKHMGGRQNSDDSVTLRKIIHSKEKDLTDGDVTQFHTTTSAYVSENSESAKKKTTFANTSNTTTTTWQQQSVAHSQIDQNDAYATDENRPLVDASKLSTIRMKLEEKRRHIEQEKRRMEIALSRHQEKVGKAAFLQAINKGKAQHQNECENKEQTKDEKGNSTENIKLPRPSNMQEEVNAEPKRENETDTKRSPDVEQVEYDKYQQSIAMMNSNLQDIQQDIHRLATQQTQIQAQHLQAQQLMQAQQIANMMSQQYGSQQNLPNQYRPVQQNFGSTPHLPQTFGSPNMYPSRPPSRDPYQGPPPAQPMQYINDQGQYINQQYYPNNHHPPQSHQQPSMYSAGSQYIGENGTHGYGGQYQDPNIYQSNQFVSRPPEYNDPYRSHDHSSPQPNQFYLHESSPQPVHRRTWAQSAAQNAQQQQTQRQQSIQLDVDAWQSQNVGQKIDTRTWKSPNPPQSTNGGFVLHQNGGCDYNSHEKSYQNLFPIHSSPQRTQRQIDNRVPVAPPPDEMTPQSISFIGDDDDSVDHLELNIESSPRTFDVHHRSSADSDSAYDVDINLSKLNISSGSRTYRIPSPSRPLLNAKSFQDPQDEKSEKGFYISFDNEQPKRPKPPLRAKRSPKKERSIDGSGKREQENENLRDSEQKRNTQNSPSNIENKSNTYNKHDNMPIPAKRFTDTQAHPANNNQIHSVGSNVADRNYLEEVTNHQNVNVNNNTPQKHSEKTSQESKALIIGTELSNLDPNSIDEMERKKEKIMLLSLQRRQQQEEAKARKEIEMMQRREKEREKEEERARKKEEQAARRAAILEAHKLKKAIEEAEREGKVLDKAELMHSKQIHATQSAAKLRPQKVTRPRPKTIHVETGSVDLSEASSLSSRGKKGSSTNLTGYSPLSSNSMRRDYYRGSQDSLAVKEPTIERGRTLSRISIAKGSTLNFRGRKSNSLMNLCDTDSGIGRATPPRRAPSPGMGPSGRHLPSPSGPGSLPPGLMSKRRVFDDGSSDISSTPSSMMEYSGPKLYKQPAAKSNRGIILNAVEYCVFPGAVNREAKQKVLEKIARSEAKHFLILFRDAGCQFRALYSYWPENETVIKLYGTGPSQVDEVMFDKFFKYNSGGKCFSQVHTKHLTVTIDAFTIHNSLWQGKKVHLPSKKDMALVI